MDPRSFDPVLHGTRRSDLSWYDHIKLGIGSTGDCRYLWYSNFIVDQLAFHCRRCPFSKFRSPAALLNHRVVLDYAELPFKYCKINYYKNIRCICPCPRFKASGLKVSFWKSISASIFKVTTWTSNFRTGSILITLKNFFLLTNSWPW